MKKQMRAREEAICAVIDSANERISTASVKYLELLNQQNETKIRSENAEKLIAACKAPEAKTQTVLAAAKKTPEVKKDGESMATCREQMAALPANERAAFYKEHKADIDAGK